MNWTLSTLLAAAMMTTPVFAQSIEVTNEALLEVVTLDENGEEKITYEDVSVVLPGDAIKYLITYSNVGTSQVESIVLKSQIPPNLLYTEQSAESENASVQYSIDGGATFADREDLVVITPEGEERPAEASDLTNIIWNVKDPIAAGSSDSVSFRATVK